MSRPGMVITGLLSQLNHLLTMSVSSTCLSVLLVLVISARQGQ